jgi:hypothetical protein
MALFISCKDSNNNNPAAPSVTEPSSQNVVVGNSIDITFNVATEAGYASSSVTATNGDATIKSEPSADAPSGDVVVTYTGNSEGAGSVKLTVTDKDGLTANATAVITVNKEQKEFRITDNITEDTTWKQGNTYILGGRIAVTAGATLTIEPGTLIKGEAGQGSNSSVLIVAKDAEIQANGTADAPIIFTSVADEITPEDIAGGNFQSPNLSPDQKGLWGGVIILGNAHASLSSGTTGQVEGIPETDSNGQYGGTDDSDSSGSFTFVSIRHGGTNIGQGNEINGLSLGGVGTGTTLDHIEIVGNTDDGVEFFGGAAHVTNLLVWNNGDDAVDTDQAFTGIVDNIVEINPGESGFELDGPEGSYEGDGHEIMNATCYMMETSEELIDVDDITDVNIHNILFYGLPVNDDGTAGITMSSDYPDFVANNPNGTYSVHDIEAVIPSGLAVSDYFTGGSDSKVTEVADYSSATVGASNISENFSFTWAHQAGALADIGLE